MMQQVVDWLSLWLDTLLGFIDPVRMVNGFSGSLASQLPTPSGAVSSFFSQASLALVSVLDYISLLDYFVNLPLLLGVFTFIGGFELILFVPRAWRFVRSFLT